MQNNKIKLKKITNEANTFSHHYFFFLYLFLLACIV